MPNLFKKYDSENCFVNHIVHSNILINKTNRFIEKIHENPHLKVFINPNRTKCY